MTDHELCLAAAKAAGYTVESVHGGWYHCTAPKVPNRIWNPLKSDMDAFRLMVDCGMDIDESGDGVRVSIYGDINDIPEAFEMYGNDKHAATRRAIVRAAAVMGESK
jgi:hypothetical protein